MICFGCEATLQPNDRFCPDCGRQVKGRKKKRSSGKASKPVKTEPCPKCGFTYGWLAGFCAHCNYEVPGFSKPGADQSDSEATNRALADIYSRRRCIGNRVAIALLVATGIGCIISPFAIGGLLLASSAFASGRKHGVSESQYYSLPGARFENGDHRCIGCGHRGRNGRGIYTRGRYGTYMKYHACSQCKRELFRS